VEAGAAHKNRYDPALKRFRIEERRAGNVVHKSLKVIDDVRFVMRKRSSDVIGLYNATGNRFQVPVSFS
jgi:hypothetical protein